MRVDGQCHCGTISYSAEINPDYVVICHCTDCQTISGAPYRASVPVKLENFALRGKPKTYVKTGDSGNRIVTSFCAECGTSLFSSRQENPVSVNLRLGSVNQRAQLVPRSQGFCRSAIPWATDISGIRRIPDDAHAPRRSDPG